MKSLRQLGFLKLPFRQDDTDGEDTRVLALFRKRAELKKAYGELQDEIYRLKDRIKQQEGATQRVQEMLSTLEQRLGAQESGYPALVFYQLRGFWQLGRELLEQFVADLARQLEERERRAHFADHNRRIFSRRQSVEAQLRLAETAAAEAGARAAHPVLAFFQTQESRSSDRVGSRFGGRRGCGARRGAQCFRDTREGSCARISRTVSGCAARDQSGGHRLFRSSVSAACEDAACKSRA